MTKVWDFPKPFLFRKAFAIHVGLIVMRVLK